MKKLTFIFCLVSVIANAGEYDNIPQKEFGYGNKEDFFEWQKNKNDINELVKVEEPSQNATTISVKYSSDDVKERVNNNASIVTGTYKDNKVFDNEAYGGAVYNASRNTMQITGTFINNEVKSASDGTDDNAWGGAIANSENSVLTNVNGTFIGNKAIASEDFIPTAEAKIEPKENQRIETGDAGGGAISNAGISGNIMGDFIGNYAQGKNAYGGAILSSMAMEGANSMPIVGTVTGNFTGNSILATNGAAEGGAVMILNYLGDVNVINSKFYNNQAISKGIDGYASGGGLSGFTISSIPGMEVTGTTNVVNTDFVKNSAIAESVAYGGGFSTYMGATVINSNFYDNYALGQNYALGGAIANTYGGDLNIIADNGKSEFSGNYIAIGEKGTENYIEKDNAVYTTQGNLNLLAKNNGLIKFEDGILGESYNVNVQTDATSEVMIDSDIENAYMLNVSDGSTLHVGKNANINVGDLALNESTMKVDVNINEEDKTISNGLIKVENDITGKADVVVNAENPNKLLGVNTMFINAENDTIDEETQNQFTVKRVIGSPYMWDAIHNAEGETTGSNWYLSQKNVSNPNYTPETEDDNNSSGSIPVYAPEVAAFTGIQQAALEQNKTIANSVSRGLSPERDTICRNGTCTSKPIKKHKKAWIDTSYESAEIENPTEIETEIKGVTAGIDLYRDNDDRFGIFGAYRDGEYDLSGKGKYYAEIGSDINTESYLGGLYYNYDNKNWAMLATLFAGKQDMDISTRDNVISLSTDAMQYGASFDVAKRFAISRYLDLEPSLELYYTMIDVDDINDNYGKTAEFDTMHYLEAALGLKLEYLFCRNGCTNKLYVKPSIIRTLSSGGKTMISGLDHKVRSYKDRTLARMEAGGEFGITSRMFGYAGAGYTFGDDYEAYDVNVGLNYAF